MKDEPEFPKWNSEPYESYYRKKMEERKHTISESQINNIIEVLENLKGILESFIENFIMLKQIPQESIGENSSKGREGA